jgi:hypothetical protein
MADMMLGGVKMQMTERRRRLLVLVKEVCSSGLNYSAMEEKS